MKNESSLTEQQKNALDEMLYHEKQIFEHIKKMKSIFPNAILSDEARDRYAIELIKILDALQTTAAISVGVAMLIESQEELKNNFH